MSIFHRDRYHTAHWFFGHGAVSDIRKLNGKFRSFIYGFCRNEGHRDYDTFDEASRGLIVMHRRLFNGVVWC